MKRDADMKVNECDILMSLQIKEPCFEKLI